MTPDHCLLIPIPLGGKALAVLVRKTTREREDTFTRWTVVSLILVPILDVDEQNRSLADEGPFSPYALPPCSIRSVSCTRIPVRKSTSTHQRKRMVIHMSVVFLIVFHGPHPLHGNC